jgi:hypothetical protein
VQEILYEAKIAWFSRFGYHGYWGGLEMPDERFQLGVGKGPNVSTLCELISNYIVEGSYVCGCR